MTTDSTLFGNANRTLILQAIALLKQTWASELAALLSLRLFTVQTVLAALEREGAIAARMVGRSRLVELDPRYFAARELEALLQKMGLANRELQSMLALRRRRPRRSGKSL